MSKFPFDIKKTQHKIDQHADPEKLEKLTNEIEFLSNTSTHAEEALLSDSYLCKCCDSFLRSSNRGFMTLVSVKHFDFGVELIEKCPPR